MKRDPDLIREILLNVEAHPDWMMPNVTAATDHMTLLGHVKLLQDAKYLVAEKGKSGATHGYRITWQGHEFLDDIRDPEIWRKTKGGAKEVGSWSIKLLGDLATGFVRAKAIELGLPIVA